MTLRTISLMASAGMVAAVWMTGCKAGSKAPAESAGAVNSGLSSLGDDAAPERLATSTASNKDRSQMLLEQASVDLQEAIRQKRENQKRQEDTRWARADTGTAPGGSEQPLSPSLDTPSVTPGAISPGAAAPDASQAHADAPPGDATAPSFGLANAADGSNSSGSSIIALPETPAPEAGALAAESSEQRAVRVFDEFRSLMAERGATSGSWRDFFVAAAVPAVASPTPAPIAVPGNAPANLGPRELASLDAALKFFEDLTSGQASSGDPAAVSDAVQRVQQTLDPQQMVRVPAAVLCSKVMGYGRYEPFRSNVFPAGVANRAILYVEVDRMSHRQPKPNDPGLTTGDQWAVEVSQELELRLDGDATLQWRRPEETAIETSRNKRRDFYLLQEIELPATLSVGTYQLKVIVRDRAAASSSPDASAYPRSEAIVEFKIAADPNAGR